MMLSNKRGNLELKSKLGCTIVGPNADKERIPGIDVELKDKEVWKFGDVDMITFDTPGHTKGHITLYFPDAGSAFTGDTMFLLGCGRLFEGSPLQMWTSLSKIAMLPPETIICCGHEYTQSNARFAVSVDPENTKLSERKQQIDEMRSKGIPTVPATLAEELQTNPFLRAADPNIKKNLGLQATVSDIDAFTAVRRAKDNF